MAHLRPTQLPTKGEEMSENNEPDYERLAGRLHKPEPCGCGACMGSEVTW